MPALEVIPVAGLFTSNVVEITEGVLGSQEAWLAYDGVMAHHPVKPDSTAEDVSHVCTPEQECYIKIFKR